MCSFAAHGQRQNSSPELEITPFETSHLEEFQVPASGAYSVGQAAGFDGHVQGGGHPALHVVEVGAVRRRRLLLQARALGKKLQLNTWEVDENVAKTVVVFMLSWHQSVTNAWWTFRWTLAQTLVLGRCLAGSPAG